MSYTGRKRTHEEFSGSDNDVIDDSMPPPKKKNKHEDAGEKGWECPICTFINKGIVLQCEICSEMKPFQGRASEQSNNNNNNQNNNNNNNKSKDNLSRMDTATRETILKLISCNVCDNHNNETIELACNHKICFKCGKNYLIKGINSKLWEKQSLICPVNECKQPLSNKNLKQWLIGSIENNNNESNNNSNKGNKDESNEKKLS